MKCPLCCEFVPNEELLQDHYLTTCSGLAEESEDEVVLEAGNKKKFQYISPTTPDQEIYFLSTSLDVMDIECRCFFNNFVLTLIIHTLKNKTKQVNYQTIFLSNLLQIR